MGDATTLNRSVDGPVKDLPDPILEITRLMDASGLSPKQFAIRHGVNPGLTYRLQRSQASGQLCWSSALVAAFTNQEWRTATLAFKPEAGASYPHYVVAPYAPRRCDVTDRWFVPTDSRQRFAPGLSEAVRRAARRDLARARQKYAQLGDWGR